MSEQDDPRWRYVRPIKALGFKYELARHYRPLTAWQANWKGVNAGEFNIGELFRGMEAAKPAMDGLNDLPPLDDPRAIRAVCEFAVEIVNRLADRGEPAKGGSLDWTPDARALWRAVMEAATAMRRDNAPPLPQVAPSPADGAEGFVNAFVALAEWCRAVTTPIADAANPQPTGLLSGPELSNVFGIPAERQEAFLKALERKRWRLNKDSRLEVGDRKPNGPAYLYRADAPDVRRLAEQYRTPKAKRRSRRDGSAGRR